MNQHWAWLWGEAMWPPLRTDQRYIVRHSDLRKNISLADASKLFRRYHAGYGLLVGRVFIGLTVSREVNDDL